MRVRHLWPSLLALLIVAPGAFAAPAGAVEPTESSVRTGFDRLQAAMDRDDRDTADRLANECMQAAHQTGDLALIAQALMMKGESEMADEADTGARKHLLNAMGLAVELGDRNIRANVLNDLGILAERDGMGEAAESYYRESLSIAQTLKDPVLLDAVSFDLGAILYEQGDLAGGYALLQGARDRSKERHDDLNVAKVQVKMAEFERAMKQADKANHSANDALDQSRKLKYRPTELAALRVLALLAIDRNDLRAAESSLKDALVSANDGEDKWAIAGAAYDLGQFYANKGRPDDAIRYLSEAQQTFRQLGRKEFAEQIGKTLNKLDGGKQL